MFGGDMSRASLFFFLVLLGIRVFPRRREKAEGKKLALKWFFLGPLTSALLEGDGRDE